MKKLYLLLLSTSLLFLTACFAPEEQPEDNDDMGMDEIEDIVGDSEEEQSDDDFVMDGDEEETVEEQDEEETVEEQDEEETAEEQDEEETVEEQDEEDPYIIQNYENYTDLYMEYIEDNISDIVYMDGDFEVININWQPGNVAVVNFQEGESTYTYNITISYDDGVVINDVEEVSQEEPQQHEDDEDTQYDTNEEDEDLYEEDEVYADQINFEYYTTEDGQIDYASIYQEYIEENIGDILDTDKDIQIDSFEWVEGNTVRVTYSKDDEINHSDIQVYIDDNHVQIQSIEDVELEQTEEQPQDDEDDNDDVDGYQVDLEAYTDEDGNVDYFELYYSVLEENIGDIVYRSGDFEIEDIEWVEGTVARVVYGDGYDSFVAEIEVSLWGNTVQIQDYEEVSDFE
ncbi:hypothetical protein [Candidatus Absconditicoccus praedator]|uniref:hypothetical protein n=1 Tax=Candidatus Absconditicoccus praedator TaxID=2735562 RepID=UPI001E57AD98|nr:hypothetical protein [Candidatus Absconditicoccus praedator]UFX83515.1 hypothetical protein HLG78_05290 [Candidatus Absconditicoccus praedator]